MGPVASVRASNPRSGLVLAMVIVVVSSGGRGDHALLGGVAGSPQYLPRADILQPEPDEAMLTESGGMLLLFQVFDWESGRMRVKVRTDETPMHTPARAVGLMPSIARDKSQGASLEHARERTGEQHSGHGHVGRTRSGHGWCRGGDVLGSFRT